MEMFQKKDRSIQGADSALLWECLSAIGLEDDREACIDVDLDALDLIQRFQRIEIDLLPLNSHGSDSCRAAS